MNAENMSSPAQVQRLVGPALFGVGPYDHHLRIHIGDRMVLRVGDKEHIGTVRYLSRKYTSPQLIGFQMDCRKDRILVHPSFLRHVWPNAQVHGPPHQKPKTEETNPTGGPVQPLVGQTEPRET
jgi:hypothetical protein